jgi:hypothetical protein
LRTKENGVVLPQQFRHGVSGLVAEGMIGFSPFLKP